MLNNKPNTQQHDSHIRVKNKKKNIVMNLKSAKCPKCGVVFRDGKWQWNNALFINSSWCICPACQLIDKHQPASYLTLYLKFAQLKRTNLLKFIYTKTNQQLNVNPLDRLMTIKEPSNGVMIISFTNRDSAERVGKQLVDQYGGLLEAEETKTNRLKCLRWSNY